MVSIVSANSTPSPVYNKTGLAFVNLSTTLDGNGSAVEVPALSGHVIVIASPINPPGLGDGFYFSPDFQYGDVVEFVETVSFACKVLDENMNLVFTMAGSTIGTTRFIKVPNGLTIEWMRG